jgi:D-alanyl-D-alanine carboxypeptidase
MVSRTRIAAVFALAGALALSGAAMAGATTATGAADRAVNRSLAALMAQPEGPPGAYVLVNRNGHVRGFAAGRTRVGGGEVPGSGRHMRIASLTKAFTAATAYSLVADGRLSLDSTVGQVLPSQPAAWHAVTLRQLLNHTGGIPDFARSPEFGAAVRANPRTPPPPATLVGYVADQPLDFAPGSRFQYTNSGPILTGLMIEAATGQQYGAALGARVLGPMALRHTTLPGTAAVPMPTLRGYAWSDGAPADVTTAVAFGGWGWASGGLVSTPSDVSRFVRRYVPTVASVAFVPGSSSPRGPGVNAAGPGVFRYTTPCGVVYGHTGSILGDTQFMAATRDGRRSAVVSMSTQVTPALLPPLRRTFAAAVCAALAP